MCCVNNFLLRSCYCKVSAVQGQAEQDIGISKSLNFTLNPNKKSLCFSWCCWGKLSCVHLAYTSHYRTRFANKAENREVCIFDSKHFTHYQGWWFYGIIAHLSFTLTLPVPLRSVLNPQLMLCQLVPYSLPIIMHCFRSNIAKWKRPPINTCSGLPS